MLGLRFVGLLPHARAAEGPYGPLLAADANGIMLPAGFTSRIVARSGQAVGATGYTWHLAPDGGATFPVVGGGWTYVSNSEVSSGGGGASYLRFDGAGAVVAAGRMLSGTTRNCAGGPTPWGTWLSCEETGTGRVWECDPSGATAAVVRPALGVFSHEAAAADPVRGHVYLTEDQPDGRLYRFTPTTIADLSAGQLQVATVVAGSVSWTAVPDPSASIGATRLQVPTSTAFNGGEGAWYDGTRDAVLFTTKGDNKVWELDCANQTLSVIYDPLTSSSPILSGVDNIVAAKVGDIYVCEDGGDMQLVLLDPGGGVSAFLQVVGQNSSELTGPAFDPSRTRLYVSSQRGTDGNGITYEITGPFRETLTPPPTTTTSTSTTTTTTTSTTTTTQPPTTTTTKPKGNGKPPPSTTTTTPTTVPGGTTTTTTKRRGKP